MRCDGGRLTSCMSHLHAGALHTHRSLSAHIDALVSAWEWQAEDRVLHCLPLHHVHGIINALHCAHAVGATVEFQPKFSPMAVWAALMVRACTLAPSACCLLLQLDGILKGTL